jgi:hypothetical protein
MASMMRSPRRVDADVPLPAGAEALAHDPISSKSHI